MAEAYGTRPSAVLGLETALGAWTLDETCLMVGRQLEKEFAKGNNPFEQKFGQRASGYSSATVQGAKTTKIAKNGIW